MFGRTKYHAAYSAISLIVGFLFSFILSLCAGNMQDLHPTHINVMGVTMPPWFYVLLAVNSLFYIMGGFQFVAMIASYFIESGSHHASEREVTSVANTADAPVEVIHPIFSDDAFQPVYDPQLALRS